MKCRICESESNKVFEKSILKKYRSAFYRCSACGFVQTDKPVWLKDAYSSAITLLDIGLIERNIALRDETIEMIELAFPDAVRFLDFAGGYGMFVRMMRDKGYDFFRQDIYCENLFAKFFDLDDSGHSKFDVITAFEVFEHFEDPVNSVPDIFKYGDNLIFSTKLAPADDRELENWWYLSTETGQHLSFYSEESLRVLASSLGKNYYNNGRNLHLFTSLTLSEKQLDFLTGRKRNRSRLMGLKKQPLFDLKSRRSLLENDYQHIKKKIEQAGE